MIFYIMQPEIPTGKKTESSTYGADQAGPTQISTQNQRKSAMYNIYTEPDRRDSAK